MRLVSFGKTTIQKGKRIKLDDNLLRNLGIGEGDEVELWLDTENGTIIVSKPDFKPEPKTRTRRSRP